jgi:uncharacterized repeat protein (TIGR01451 family)
MKKNLTHLLFFFFCCASSGFSQTYIPDKNFANAIRSWCSSCITSKDILTAHATTLEILHVEFKNITSLDGVEAFVNLKTFYCSHNQISSLSNLPSKLVDLYCGHNKITYLPNLPSTLTNLDCGSNPLKVLPNLPNNLKYLACDDDSLTALPSLPDSLTALMCWNNLLKELPKLPNNLNYLGCVGNKLTSLPNLPNSIEYLDCRWNQLTNLPALPNSLTNLECSNNQLVSLPSFPNSLKEVYCQENKLKHLPEMPNSLTYLDCATNQIENLFYLSSNLKYLDCSKNKLTSIPILPTKLTELRFSFNQVTQLPNLPSTLTHLVCQKNQLTNLPTLPKKLQLLICSNNNNLSCINSKLPVTLEALYLDSTLINCLPNLPVKTYIDKTLPICDASNSGICFFLPSIKGKTYIDFADDGIKNNNDLVVPLQLIEGDATTYGVTDNTGAYNLGADINKTLVIKPQQVSPHYTVKPSQYTITTTGIYEQVYTNYDFRLVPQANVADLEVFIASSVQRPGFNGTLTITYRNIGTIPLSGQISLEKDAVATFVSANPVENNQNNGIYYWSFSNLNPFETRTITILINIPATTPLGTVLSHRAVGTSSDSGEVLLDNNLDTERTTIVGSYDPNDKTADNPYIEPQEIGKGKPITYTIRFQNTGNYYAERVEVQDTISSLFDLSTLKTIATSHPSYKVSIETDRFKKGQPTVVKWTFDKIFLQDSTTNEAASHGFVRFSIAVKQGLPLAIGSALENKAHIYFDYNQPIVTNTSKVTVEIKVSTATELEAVLPLRVYPNPSSELLYVETLGSAKGQLTLTNTLGQVIENQSFKSQNTTTFDIHSLPNGVYFLTLKTKDGTRIAKIVKQE